MWFSPALERARLQPLAAKAQARASVTTHHRAARTMPRATKRASSALKGRASRWSALGSRRDSIQMHRVGSKAVAERPVHDVELSRLTAHLGNSGPGKPGQGEGGGRGG